MRKSKGFTLVELIIVIVIVGILSIVAVPMYRDRARKAIAAEGIKLVETVRDSIDAYNAINPGALLPAPSGGVMNFGASVGEVDARANKYYRTFTVTNGGYPYTITATGQTGNPVVVLVLQDSDFSTITLDGVKVN